ncbi:MAG TPA: hypothetical protein DCE18_02060 [Syntrophobacteraceae bacterium]|nr:hypothetical protein [Syntrophobacteraceae bacterium]
MPATNRYRRLWAYGSNTIVTSVVFLAILVVVILIVEKHPWRKDLTESGKYTLSPQTRKILDSIKEPVKIKAFFRSTEQDRGGAKDLLDTYTYYNDKLSYEFIDPDLQPEVARQYEIRTYSSLVLEGFNKKQSVQRVDEESLTNALFKLTQKQVKKIYFLVGHGEHTLADTGKDGYATLREALDRENYQIADLSLLQQEHVPDDAAAVVVGGPRKPLMAPEIAALKSYLQKNGKLLLMLDPYHDAGLKELVESYGLQLHDDIVVDKLSRVFGGSYTMPVVTQYGLHKITEGFNIATFYPEARSVRPAQKAPPGVRLVALASTSQEAWSEMDQQLFKQGQAGYDEKTDLPGPVPIAAIAEITPKGGEQKGPTTEPTAAVEADKETQAAPTPTRKSYLLVCGNSAFADNTHFNLSGNGDLFLNMINFLAEEESLIAIERRDTKGQPLVLTLDQERLLFWTSLVLVPCLILVIGAAVYRVRRSQR